MRSWSLYCELFWWKIEATRWNWSRGIRVPMQMMFFFWHLLSVLGALQADVVPCLSSRTHRQPHLGVTPCSKLTQLFCFSPVLQVLLCHHWSWCTPSVPWKQTKARAKPSTSDISSASRAASVRCLNMVGAMAMRTTSWRWRNARTSVCQKASTHSLTLLPSPPFQLLFLVNWGSRSPPQFLLWQKYDSSDYVPK